MKTSALILISLCLLVLPACSTTPAEVKVVTKIELARPPAALLDLCKAPPSRLIQTTRDVIDSRQDWETQYGLCAKKIERLRQWYEQVPK